MYPLKYLTYLKLLHSTMSYSVDITSRTVSRYSIRYIVRNSSTVTLGQNSIYEEENIDSLLPLLKVLLLGFGLFFCLFGWFF